MSLDATGKPTYTIQTDAAWDRMAWTPELEIATNACQLASFVCSRSGAVPELPNPTPLNS